jgi:hypothetical protein
MRQTLEEAVKKYSEKEYSTPKPLAICIDFARFGAEWQAKQMYSEDQVREIIAETWLSCEDNEGESFTKIMNRILNQFKNADTNNS